MARGRLTNGHAGGLSHPKGVSSPLQCHGYGADDGPIDPRAEETLMRVEREGMIEHGSRRRGASRECLRVPEEDER
jgi:hypothetical protein